LRWAAPAIAVTWWMPWVIVVFRRALDLGCMLSINPDAHSVEELDLTRWCIAVARKGGVPKERVLNCLTHSEFKSFLGRRRARRA
jgi:DNA polymerase (family 10)